jgi:hypothetical protein
VIEAWRQRFNRGFSQDAFLRVLRAVEDEVGGPIPFRLAESPIFLPGALVDEMRLATEAILAEVFAHPEYADRVRRHVPPHAFLPTSSDHPPFVQCDFALAEGDDGRVVPRLIEIQGFPSLYAFQHALCRAYQEAFALTSELTPFGRGIDEAGFLALFRQAVLGGHDPETVALVDVHPWKQGTWPDFRLTQKLLPGLAVVDATEILRRGDGLFYRRGGHEVKIARIFNRLVWEDVRRVESELAFRLGEPLDVEWAGEPGWFFQLSKLVLPLVSHPSVPRSYFLDEHAVSAADLHRYVLKPLFSFAGKGLVLDLDEEALAAIPEAERASWVLQEKVRYADVVKTPDGGRVRCEVRLMFLWLDRPVHVLVLPRFSRGRLMGCAFNTADPWTGHGVAFIIESGGAPPK